MLSDRLTQSRKEAQMHEADVEQDDSVAEYFADRTEEMARRVAADEARMTALAADAEEVRIAMVTDELDTVVASYNDTLRTMAEQLAALEAQVARAAALSRRAEELAATLPASAARQHQASDAVATRTATIGERLQTLQDAVAEPVT
jgi:ketopantoate hydroxymethyltransferase